MEIQNRQSIRVVDQPALARLQSSLRGNVILPDNPEYDGARRIWNGMFDRYPALVVQCAGTPDVVQAVRFAREQNLVIAVRGGGHGIPGYATIDNGMVIDLSLMKDVIIDQQRQTVLASAGLLLIDLMDTLHSYGFVTPTGTVHDTGMAGLTLGGGLGSLNGKFGMAVDNVLSFEMVTADGEVVQASAMENPDLYWGLRGGGGNFGVVTTFEFQLYPAIPMLGGMLIYPRSREVLQFYRDFANQTPDELTVYAALATSPDGHPVTLVLPCYYGDLKEGERLLEPLRTYGPPLVDMVRPLSYPEMIHVLDPISVRGRNYYDKGVTLPDMTDEVIDLMLASASQMISPYSSVLIQHLHGAAGRVAPEATAYAARGNSYMPIYLAAWDEGPNEPHIEWSRNGCKVLQPYSVEKANINFITPEERVAGAFAGNYARLVDLKRRYDPQNVFRMNPNIRPD